VAVCKALSVSLGACRGGCVAGGGIAGTVDVVLVVCAWLWVLGALVSAGHTRYLAEPLQHRLEVANIQRHHDLLQRGLEDLQGRAPWQALLMYWHMSTIPRLHILDWAGRLWLEGPGTFLDHGEHVGRRDQKSLVEYFQRGAEFFRVLGPAQLRGECCHHLGEGVQHRDIFVEVRQRTQDCGVGKGSVYGPNGWVERIRHRLNRPLQYPTDLLAVPIEEGHVRDAFVPQGESFPYGMSGTSCNTARASEQLLRGTCRVGRTLSFGNTRSTIMLD